MDDVVSSHAGMVWRARADTPSLNRTALKPVPHTKRSRGPKVAAAGNPAKYRPGTDDWNVASRAGELLVRRSAARQRRVEKRHGVNVHAVARGSDDMVNDQLSEPSVIAHRVKVRLVAVPGRVQ